MLVLRGFDASLVVVLGDCCHGRGEIQRLGSRSRGILVSFCVDFLTGQGWREREKSIYWK